MAGGVCHRGYLVMNNKKIGQVDVSDEAIHWELGSLLSYGEYL